MNKMFVLLAFLLLPAAAFSQSGMKFPEFSKRLEMYFHTDLISDIQKEMPDNDFSVWGWDVGDFSDDGNNDVAFSIRRSGLKDKVIDVYLFVDIDGYLVKVGQFQFDFFELPLEVGVAIRNQICHVTQKFKQFNWDIKSFKFVNGSLVNYDLYSTRRIGKLTKESYRNYYNLQNTERYIQTNSGTANFAADYLAIPCYSRGRMIYKGFTTEALANRVEYVPVGAYWWSGDEDLSYTVNSVYDDQFLYISVNVADDYVVTPFCDTCASEAIEIWIDANDYDENNNRFAAIKDENVAYNTNSKTGIYKFEITAGDFINRKPSITMSSSDDLTSVQKLAARNLDVVCDMNSNGYYAMLKIPFSALGKTAPPLKNDSIVEWGCTVRVIDYDNEFRPERKTILETSVFESSEPASYGSLLFIPDSKWYGETHNIMKDKIINALESFGF